MNLEQKWWWWIHLDHLLLIKQNQKLVKEQSVSDIENKTELMKSLLDQIENLWKENSIENNVISKLLNNSKVLLNNEENFSYISNNSNLNSINY